MLPNASSSSHGPRDARSVYNLGGFCQIVSSQESKQLCEGERGRRQSAPLVFAGSSELNATGRSRFGGGLVKEPKSGPQGIRPARTSTPNLANFAYALDKRSMVILE
jgi:hypothetical protein